MRFGCQTHQGARQPLCSYLCTVNGKILDIYEFIIKIEYSEPSSTAFKKTPKCYYFICSCHVCTTEEFVMDQNSTVLTMPSVTQKKKEEKKGRGKEISLSMCIDIAFVYRYRLFVCVYAHVYTCFLPGKILLCHQASRS